MCEKKCVWGVGGEGGGWVCLRGWGWVVVNSLLTCTMFQLFLIFVLQILTSRMVSFSYLLSSIFFWFLDLLNEGPKKYSLHICPFVCMFVFLFVHFSRVFIWNYFQEFSDFLNGVRMSSNLNVMQCDFLKKNFLIKNA